LDRYKTNPSNLVCGRNSEIECFAAIVTLIVTPGTMLRFWLLELSILIAE